MEIAQLLSNRTTSEIISCDVGMSVKDAVALLAGKRIGALPVMSDGKVAGIFSERDILYRVAEEGAACLDRSVGDIMTSPAITVSPGTRVIEALALMTKRRIRHLPVVDGDTMSGFISIGDLVKSRIDEVEHEAEAMRAYIQTA